MIDRTSRQGDIAKYRVEEIDNFEMAIDYPRSSICDAVKGKVEALGEKEHIEPIIRIILHDPNVTGHGPTEYADVITVQTMIGGRTKLAAFVNKGSSCAKVKQKHVSHQFDNARAIPGLDLLVFLATGDVDDKAKVSFYQHAEDAGCGSLFIDALDFARILIAYGFMCPQDGSLLTDRSCPECCYIYEEKNLQQPETTQTDYTILRLEDISHGLLKRYAAHILIDPNSTPDAMRSVIVKATEDIKVSEYYRSEQVERLWTGKPAGAVWLYLYKTLDDSIHVNWVCMTLWIAPDLPDRVRPLDVDADEYIDGIGITWNRTYEVSKTFRLGHSASKQEVIRIIENSLRAIEPMVAAGIDATNAYKKGTLDIMEYETKMGRLEVDYTAMYLAANNFPFAPVECADYDHAFQKLLACGANIFLYFSKHGLEHWDDRARKYLVQGAIKDMSEARADFEYERKKLKIR